MATRTARETAFSPKRFDQINATIKRLATRAVAFQQSGLTHDDLLHLFVKPSDREHCIAGKKLFGVVRTHTYATVASELGSLRVDFYMHINTRHTGVALPKYSGTHVYADNEEANAKLTAWADWRAQRAAEWGNVAAVFYKLHSVCESPAQVRAVFPGILALLDSCMQIDASDKPCEAAAKQAERLRTFRSPPHMPRLSLELKQAAKLASDTLALVGLLPCHIKEPPQAFQPVTLRLDAFDMPAPAWDKTGKLPIITTGY